MAPRRRFAVAAVLVALVVLVSGCLESDATQRGDAVPDFVARDVADGMPRNLSDFRGEVVLLNLWATWCEPCREEMPGLEALYRARAHEGFRVVGVSVDEKGDADEVRSFAHEFDLTFTVLHDPDERAARALRTIGTPESFLIDRDGLLLHAWRGPFEPLSADTDARVTAALAGDAKAAGSSVPTVGLLVAFGGGVLSFLSPCVLPLIPSYAGVITGMSLDTLTATDASRGHVRRVVLTRGLLFTGGFSLVFISLGASASFASGLLRDNGDWIARIGGALLIVLALHLLDVLRLPGADRDTRIQMAARRFGPVGAFLVGVAFAAGWSPCIGPILAAILTLAAATGSVAAGMGLLTAYSIGFALPFLAATVGLGRFLSARKRTGKWLPWVRRATGVLVGLLGLLLLTGLFTVLQAAANKWFPWTGFG